MDDGTGQTGQKQALPKWQIVFIRLAWLSHVIWLSYAVYLLHVVYLLYAFDYLMQFLTPCILKRGLQTPNKTYDNNGYQKYILNIKQT